MSGLSLSSLNSLSMERLLVSGLSLSSLSLNSLFMHRLSMSCLIMNSLNGLSMNLLIMKGLSMNLLIMKSLIMNCLNSRNILNLLGLRSLQCWKSMRRNVCWILFDRHGSNCRYFVVISCTIRSHVTCGPNTTWLRCTLVHLLHPAKRHLECLAPLKLLHFLGTPVWFLDIACFFTFMWFVPIAPRFTNRFWDLVHKLQPVFRELGHARLSTKSSEVSHSRADYFSAFPQPLVVSIGPMFSSRHRQC